MTQSGLSPNCDLAPSRHGATNALRIRALHHPSCSKTEIPVAQCVGVATSRLPNHFLRLIDTGDGSSGNAVQQPLNGNTGPESDLHNLVVRPNIEHLDDLFCGIPVRARHDYSAQPSQDTLRTPEHAHQEFAHPKHSWVFRESSG
jgi:hypothetical protein